MFLSMKKNYLFEIIIVFVITIVAYGYFYYGTDWNSNSRLALIKAVVEERRFEIDTYHDKILETYDKAKVGSHYYSDKAIGTSLVGIAFYAPLYRIYRALGMKMGIKVFHKVIVFFAISFLCAFLAPFLYSFAKRISNHAKFSLLVTFAICLGTPLYKYSTVYYGHSLVGMFLFVVFFIWFNIKDDAEISLKKVLISGYLLGFTMITEYPTAIIVFFLGLYILYILWKKQSLSNIKIYVCFAISILIPVSVLLMYNVAVFDHPFKTGYGYEVVPEFLVGQQGGLMGIGWPNLNSLFFMTFHTTMGVFWQSPVLLLAFVGWVRMWQGSQYRVEAIFSFSVILVYFLVMSGYFIWWGGSAFTPRNIIPAFPFFGIPLVFLTRKPEKSFAIILGLISIAQMFVVAAANNGGIGPIAENMLITSVQTMFQQASMIYNVYVPNFINQVMGPNRGTDFFKLTGFQSLIPFFVIEACLLVAFMKITSKSAGVKNANEKDLSA